MLFSLIINLVFQNGTSALLIKKEFKRLI